jgi:PIN domain nuclease of toxin-antitoxin system
MNLLLDTQVFLWHIGGHRSLKLEDSQIIEDPSHTKFLSIASLWEIAIKTSLGKLAITQPLNRIIPEEIRVLDINVSHLMAVQKLPFYHRDPFDRLIIAQASVEGMTVMSRDRDFKTYGIPLI